MKTLQNNASINICFLPQNSLIISSIKKPIDMIFLGLQDYIKKPQANEF